MNATDLSKKHKLTVFLIKDGYAEPKDFLSFDGFAAVDVKADEEKIGQLIYKGGFQSTPSWVSIFQHVQGFNAASIKNQSSKGLFVLKRDGRWFCFTFGYARHLIDEHAYERNFGLIVTLNLGDPLAIKSIDKTNISHISLHSKEQATRDIELSSFEFNNDIDLLRSVTAKAIAVDGEDQEIFSGRDSVTIHTKVSIDVFWDVAKRLYTAFADTKYKERYPWLDKIREERDKDITEKLDLELVRRILANDFQKLWLAIPEVVSWDEIQGFAFKHKEVQLNKSGPVFYQDLDIHEWVKVAKVSKDLSATQLKSKNIFVYWQDGRPVSHWSVYRCLNAEIDLDQKKYILNDGDWYNIESSYVTEVDQFYKSISDSKVALPQYDSKTEPEYLKVVAAGSSDYALMDRKVVMIGGGRSRVEFCDLYSKNKEIIHVKQYGGSSVLSHLFSQALVSGDCFLHEVEFREKVNELLPQGFKLANTAAQPAPKDFEICIAVMSKEKGALELPFFSKVSFKHAVKALHNLGYKVTKLKIER
jgi:uncharacterized protein (TIGR04141 family)